MEEFKVGFVDAEKIQCMVENSYNKYYKEATDEKN